MGCARDHGVLRLLWPPTVVVVTSIVKVAAWPLPPAMVNVQCPMATGVIVKLDELVAGAMVAMPLQELGWPEAGVVAVNVPP